MQLYVLEWKYNLKKTILEVVLKNKSPKIPNSCAFDGEENKEIWESNACYLENSICSQEMLLHLVSTWIWMWIMPYRTNKPEQIGLREF